MKKLRKVTNRVHKTDRPYPGCSKADIHRAADVIEQHGAYRQKGGRLEVSKTYAAVDVGGDVARKSWMVYIVV